MKLEQDQKEYIKKKVKELGSLEAVKHLYWKDCLVDDYARKEAKKIYKED